MKVRTKSDIIINKEIEIVLKEFYLINTNLKLSVMINFGGVSFRKINHCPLSIPFIIK
jgi:hypothetical protein